MIQMIRRYFYLYRAYKERKAQEQLRQKQSIREYNASQAALARALSRLKYGEKKYR